MAAHKYDTFRDDGFDANAEEGSICIARPVPGPCTIQFYEDTVVGAYSLSVHGSHDGTNWSVINAAVTAETILEVLAPVPYLKVVMDAKPATSGTVYATAFWVYDD